MSQKKSAPTKKSIRKNYVRLNGWSFPLHPLQILAWIFFLLFGIVYFGLMVPILPTIGYRLTAVGVNLFVSIFHFFIHIAAINVNPADDNVIKKTMTRKNNPKKFDRTKHNHVIENQFCYICEEQVGIKSKHCSVCNKCVSDFDHHCKWLNNCIGGKNYRLFIGCVISALAGCLIVFTVAIILTIAYFSPDSWLHDKNTNLLFFHHFSNSTHESQKYQKLKLIWIGIVISTSVLSLIAVALLAHLLGFHVFLNCIGLSTYEFIVQQRNSSKSPNQRKNLNHISNYLRNQVFVCCSRNRIDPNPQPQFQSQQQLASNLNIHTDKKISVKHIQGKPNQSDQSQCITIEYPDQGSVKTIQSNHSIKSNSKINRSVVQVDNSFANQNSKSDSHLPNYASPRVDSNKNNENHDAKELQTEELNQSKQSDSLVKINKQKLNDSTESRVKIEEDDHFGGEEPIFKTLSQNPKSGRVSRLSFAARHQIGSTSPEDNRIQPNLLFVRRQPMDKFNGNLRVSPVNQNLFAKDKQQSELSIISIENHSPNTFDKHSNNSINSSTSR